MNGNRKSLRHKISKQWVTKTGELSKNHTEAFEVNSFIEGLQFAKLYDLKGLELVTANESGRETVLSLPSF